MDDSNKKTKKRKSKTGTNRPAANQAGGKTVKRSSAVKKAEIKPEGKESKDIKVGKEIKESKEEKKEIKDKKEINDSKLGKEENSKVEKTKEEKIKKIKNSKLRLVKNGDLPVDQTPAKKSPKKDTAVKKEIKKEKAAETDIELKTDKAANKNKEAETGKAANKNKEAKIGKELKKDKNIKKKTAGKKDRAGRNEYSYRRDRLDVREWYIQNKSLVIIGFTVFAVAALLFSGYYYIITNYEVTTVYVDGNIHYTNEEVMNMIMSGRYGNNSLFLSLKYKDKGVEGIPFVEKMDVSILSPDTIRINVYEKAIAGYVEYLGQYMYFDKDGIIVESSGVRTKGVPQVTGLSFNYVVMYEPLPVENEEIFKQILSITQLLGKYELNADKIFFDSAYDMTLYFGGVRVTISSEDQIDEKLMKLPSILPKLEGKSGILHYMEEGKSISFNEDT